MQEQDLPPGGAAQLGIQVGKGLIEQEQLGVPDDGAAHGHALPLAAGKLGGLFVELGGEAQNLCCGKHLFVDHIGVFLAQGEGKGHVFVDGHVAVQGVGLEDHGHVAVLGRGVGDVLAVQQQLAFRNVFKTGHHPQGGGFAAAGGTDQDDELPVLHFQVEVKDRLDVVVVDFVDML